MLERDTTEILPTDSSENNPPPEQDTDPQRHSTAKNIYNRRQSTNTTAPIQPMEPAVGLTPEEQRKKEENPNLTLVELLELIPCDRCITTPLQTLDGLHVNQPSRFLPLAQEAKKLAKKLKEEEEASEWSGIPSEQLLNESFTEQLNSIQTLQQIAPLHCTREYLPQDIIKILECSGKVESTPFDKLYYLAQNYADCYYAKVIQTFIELIKRNTADRQIVLVNSV